MFNPLCPDLIGSGSKLKQLQQDDGGGGIGNGAASPTPPPADSEVGDDAGYHWCSVHAVCFQVPLHHQDPSQYYPLVPGSFSLLGVVEISRDSSVDDLKRMLLTLPQVIGSSAHPNTNLIWSLLPPLNHWYH